MDHPVSNSRRNLLIYYLVCTFMAGIYALFVYNFYKATLWQSLAESVVYTSVFSILGLGLWFVVRFSNMENMNFFNLAVNHVAIAVVTMILWLVIGYYILNVLTFLFDDYKEFFNRLLLGRVMMGITWYIMVVLVYYVIYYYRNFHERMMLQSALQSDIKTAEMQVLKARINPHFLFNSLNSISALTLETSDKAREMIVKLSDYLRSTISEQQEGMKTLEEELISVNNYLDIEKVRFGERLTVIEDISEACKKDMVPGMIIQPLIENAIKYGVEENTGNVAIKIVADCFQGYLKVQIENRFNPEYKKPEGTGMGLNYIKKRVQLIYNRVDLVQVNANGRVFRVTLNFPQKVL